jgi:hypothetical protein
VGGVRERRYQAGHGTPAVGDHDRLATPHLIDEGAELILCLSWGSLHMARIVFFEFM